MRINSNDEIEKMIRDNNLPSLSIIGSDKLTASGGKNLKFKTFVALVTAIRFSRHLKEISISSNKIDLVAGRMIADAIASHLSLQSLSINETAIGTEGASAIFLVCHHLPITHLSLDYNKIGSKTTFSALPVNTLVELDLSNNSIGNEGGTKVAKILEESKTLKKLSLSGDLALGEAGVIALGEALQTNSSLESINLSYLSNVPLGCINKFIELIAGNKTLKSVDFSNILDPNSKKMVSACTGIKISL